MKKRTRESQLQKEIISLLSEEKNPLNVSQIARALGKHRSSVSRSVALLNARDQLRESNRGYIVTQEVIMKQNRLREEEVAQKMKEAVKAMGTVRISTDALESAMRAAAVIPFQDIAKSMQPLIESAVLNDNILKQYKEISEAAFKHVDLSMLAASADLAKIANQYIETMPKIDVSQIFKSFAYLTKNQDLIDNLTRSCLPDAISSYSRFLDDAARMQLPESRIAGLSIPTSEIIDSVSYSIVDESEGEIPASIPHSPVLSDAKRLDTELERINERFPDIRRGAWETYGGGGSDKDRQACHSMRELLNQVIDEIIPDEMKQLVRSNKKEDRPKRQEKIRAILGSSSEAKHVEALARLYDVTYDRLSAVSHARTRNDEMSIEFALSSAQHVLAYILFSDRSQDV